MSTPEGRAYLATMRTSRDRIWKLFEDHGILFSSMASMPLCVFFNPCDKVDVPGGLSEEELLAWGRAESTKCWGP